MFVAKGRNMSANIVRIFFTTETTPLPKQRAPPKHRSLYGSREMTSEP